MGSQGGSYQLPAQEAGGELMVRWDDVSRIFVEAWELEAQEIWRRHRGAYGG